MDYGEKRILVTGATGFVGGRLVERLFSSHKHVKIRALVHNPHNASRLSRFRVELVYGNMASIEAVRAAVDGCDVVVHCALGTPYETIIGTQNILNESLKFNVKKFIHISSVAVHGIRINPWATVSEEISYKLTGDAYCDAKIMSEKLVRDCQKTSTLPIVILRPANIFGPNSESWTTRPIAMLKNRSYVLVNGGATPSNAVYIDNVTDAIEKSIAKDGAIGQVITISDDNFISWKDFFSAYALMFKNVPTLYNLRFEEVKVERAKEHKQLLTKLFSNPQILFRILRARQDFRYLFDLFTKSELNSELVDLCSQIQSTSSSKKAGDFQKSINLQMLNRVPSQILVNLFVSNARFSTKSAEKFIDYYPKTSFKDGMKLTAQWLRNCGFV